MFRALMTLGLLAVLALGTGCGDDSNVAGPTPGSTNPLARWVGEYDTNVKWGGLNGTWRGSPELVVTPGGDIVYGGSLIKNPTIEGDAVSWTRADGNTHNGNILFRSEHTSEYFWRDHGNTVTGQLFTGSRQSAGEGPLDFRGLEDDD